MKNEVTYSDSSCATIALYSDWANKQMAANCLTVGGGGVGENQTV